MRDIKHNYVSKSYAAYFNVVFTVYCMKINLYNELYIHRICTSDISNSPTYFDKSQVLSSVSPPSSNHIALKNGPFYSKWAKTQPHICTCIKIQLKNTRTWHLWHAETCWRFVKFWWTYVLHVNLVIQLINLLHMFHFSFWKLKGVPGGVTRSVFQGLKGDGALVPCMESLLQNHLSAVGTPNLWLLIVVRGLRLSLQHWVIFLSACHLYFFCRSSRRNLQSCRNKRLLRSRCGWRCNNMFIP